MWVMVVKCGGGGGGGGGVWFVETVEVFTGCRNVGMRKKDLEAVNASPKARQPPTSQATNPAWLSVVFLSRH
jgi:hypothetical protein